jgi:hypothetical protein
MLTNIILEEFLRQGRLGLIVFEKLFKYHVTRFNIGLVALMKTPDQFLASTRQLYY